MASIIGHPVRREGHWRPYHEAVTEACEHAGFTHIVFAGRSRHNSDMWPPNWKHVEALDESAVPGIKGSPLGFLKEAGFWRKTLEGALPVGEGPAALILLESFNGRHIPALSRAASSLREDLSFTMMPILRTGSVLSGAYRFSVRRNGLLWPGVDFLPATDSESISHALAARYGLRTQLLPIPHLIDPGPIRYAAPKGQRAIRLWFPGEPREEKGLSVIRKLTKTLMQSALGCTLVLDERIIQPSSTNRSIATLPGPLTAEAYARELSECDAVLLPYDAERYRQATSGIFIEAVAAGKMPFVTRGTWMADELIRYELGDLTFTWEDDQPFSKFAELFASPALQSNLSRMSEDVRRLHGPLAFASVLRELSGILHRDRTLNAAARSRFDALL